MDAQQTVRSSKISVWSSVLVLVILAGSLSLNVALGWRARPSARPRALSGVEVGSLMSAIPVLDANGKHTELRFDSDRPTVLYLLAPECIWCRRNEANIRTLASAASDRYHFVGLSTQPLNINEYRRATQLPFPVYSISSRDEAAARHLVGTPKTMVIASNGKVTAAWGGAYQSAMKQEVEDYFKTKLPGLAADPSDAPASAEKASKNMRRPLCLDEQGLYYSTGARIRDKTNQILECGSNGSWAQVQATQSTPQE